MKQHAGKCVCIIEGAIPVKDDGIYCMIGGCARRWPSLARWQRRRDHRHRILRLVRRHSGGRSESDRRYRCARSVEGKTVVTIPGCPANPYNLLGTVLQYATFGTLPELDEKARPGFAYGRTIHEHTPRRAHFDAGRFAQRFGRRASPGLLSLQAGMQGAADARQLFGAQFL